MRSSKIFDRSAPFSPIFAACLLAACGDDAGSAKDAVPPDSAVQVDAGVGATSSPDASTGRPDAGQGDQPDDTDPSDGDGGVLLAQLADGSDPTDEVIPKSACVLLTAADIAAVTGFGYNPGEEHSGGEQCDYIPSNPDLSEVGTLLEVVPNGKAIFAATLDEYASTNMTAVPVTGLGDQASFTSHEGDGGSMQVTVGDLVMRLDIGWHPDRSQDDQIAGARQLLALAISRL